MTGNRKFLAYALSTAFGLVAAVGSANAACTAGLVAGVWYLEGITVMTPTATTTKGDAVSCVVTMNAGGDFSNAPCTSYHSTAAAPNVTHATGNLTLSASTCNFTGTITIVGDPVPVTIKTGHINGVMGTFVTTQGKSVGHFTLIKR